MTFDGRFIDGATGKEISSEEALGLRPEVLPSRAPDIRTTGHAKVLNNVTRVYELVGELREVIKELEGMKVEVRLGRYPTRDPLSEECTVSIFMQPGCDLIPTI